MVSKQLQAQMSEWRHQIHSHPEAAFEEKETAALVGKVLMDLGYEVHTGIGGTGVVGVLHCGTSSRAIGLRADMDCIKITEKGKHPTALKHLSGCTDVVTTAIRLPCWVQLLCWPRGKTLTEPCI